VYAHYFTRFTGRYCGGQSFPESVRTGVFAAVVAIVVCIASVGGAVAVVITVTVTAMGITITNAIDNATIVAVAVGVPAVAVGYTVAVSTAGEGSDDPSSQPWEDCVDKYGRHLCWCWATRCGWIAVWK
jgi:hypothetical protein